MKSAVRHLPQTTEALGNHVGIPHLPNLISRFLYEQQNLDEISVPLDDIPIEICPHYTGKIRVFPSAIAIYYAPSDKSGTRGMYRERIRAVNSWRGGPGRHDCIFVASDPALPGFRGLFVAQVHLF